MGQDKPSIQPGLGTQLGMGGGQVGLFGGDGVS